MKAIMTGVKIPNFLSARTLTAKIFGMILMLSSGMSLGKEGPFVHIGGCIASILPYVELRYNKTLRHQFLTAAIAVGVTCTFGAPIGGVLFAIEVSAQTFTVSNLWKSFFASTVSVLIFKFFALLDSAALFSADGSYFYNPKASLGINHEQPFFALLGVLCGILGTLYIEMQRRMNVWKKNHSQWAWVKNNWTYTLVMCLIVTNVVFSTKLMQPSDKAVINSMINVDQTIKSNSTVEEGESSDIHGD